MAKSKKLPRTCRLKLSVKSKNANIESCIPRDSKPYFAPGHRLTRAERMLQAALAAMR
jgi:hypothetical protein